MPIRNNLLTAFQLIVRKYKAEVFRPYLHFLSNSSFFFNTDAYVLKTFGLRYFNLYIHLLDPVPNDLSAKEVWEIVLCLGNVLRQWELEQSVLFSALDVLRTIVKKVIAKELALNTFYGTVQRGR